MCFNMSIIREIEEIEAEFSALFSEHPLIDSGSLEISNGFGFNHPRWPVIFSDAPKVIHLPRWGLIPHWVKSQEQALEIRKKTINARGETLHKLPSFRASIPQKTCLIPVDGFYEPYRLNNTSYPFYLHRRGGELMCFAGIYADWFDREGNRPIRTFSIVTVPSIGITDKIHHHKHRMPLILSGEKRQRWLSLYAHPEDREALLEPQEPDDLHAYPVSKSLYQKGDARYAPAVREPCLYGIPEVDGLVS